jgi:hypothetical protein
MIPSFPWFEIVCWPTRPSETVRQAGSIREAGECSDIGELPDTVFAADLWEVFCQQAYPDYQDPLCLFGGTHRTVTAISGEDNFLETVKMCHQISFNLLI